MSCDVYQEILSAFLDREATAEEAASVETHLRGCLSCKQTLEELKKNKALMRSLPRLDVPAGLWFKIKSKTEARKLVFPGFGKILRPAAAFAAVITLFLGSVTLIGYFSSEVSTSKEVNADLGGHAYHLMGQPLADQSSWSIVAGESGIISPED